VAVALVVSPKSVCEKAAAVAILDGRFTRAAFRNGRRGLRAWTYGKLMTGVLTVRRPAVLVEIDGA
jgi:hypothetical protein